MLQVISHENSTFRAFLRENFNRISSRASALSHPPPPLFLLQIMKDRCLK